MRERPSSEEIVRRGQEIYDRDFRARLEPAHHGEMVAIDIDTGDFEVGTDEVAVLDRVEEKNPGGSRCLLRVGYPYTHRLGGRFRVVRS